MPLDKSEGVVKSENENTNPGRCAIAACFGGWPNFHHYYLGCPTLRAFRRVGTTTTWQFASLTQVSVQQTDANLGHRT